ITRYGFVIYPGKISKVDTFRIGNIGDVHEQDINRLVDSISKGAVIV
ncbi:2-aminoethylphosphonate--pyruvate transaminase, partial [Bacillus cereus]|nr:2-aminoethylphosphonate--pyruvate transaminase [Bacillus cereus]